MTIGDEVVVTLEIQKIEVEKEGKFYVLGIKGEDNICNRIKISEDKLQ